MGMRRYIFIAFIVIGLLAPPTLAQQTPVTDSTCPVSTAQVVLDPGHGGDDPGAVNESFGLTEAEENLTIAQQVASILQLDHGLTVALTRVDNATTLGNSARGAIANACHASLYVSIHLNAADDTSADYAQSFWGEKEKDLAFSLIMNASLATLGIRVNDVDRFDNGGLLRARMPSVLVEGVFLTSPVEALLLKAQIRQTAIAQAIAAGIAAWFARW